MEQLEQISAYLNANTNLLFSTVIFMVVFTISLRLYNVLHLKPNRIRSRLVEQGMQGPKPAILLGNIPQLKKMQANLQKPPIKPGHFSNDWPRSVFPFFNKWTEEYGKNFTFALGTMQVLFLSGPEVVKQVYQCSSIDLGKPVYQQKEHGALLGTGILTSNGPLWAYQRKMMQPELLIEKVKNMYDLIVQSATVLVNKWDTQIDKTKGVGNFRIDDDLRNFSADVITRACFGSNYSKSQEIFLRIGDLRKVMVKKSFLLGLPGLRHLPIKSNRDKWRLEKEIRRLIMNVVEEREQKAQVNHKDLLQVIIEGAKGGNFSKERMDRFVADNCKNVYIAGDETTGITICWTLLLLAAKPEYQTRVREEVLQGFQGQSVPDFETLRKMKWLTMVIQESMRLYPTVSIMSKEALEDLEFGNIKVPKGTIIWLPLVMLNRDKELWGPDAEEFNPERFANGVAGACKIPQLYQPFGSGPRICIGMNLAMMEIRLAIALLLSKFSFSVPPDYCHSPAYKLILQPEHGLNLNVKRI
uniref:Cytochrome P450 CYP714E38 n=1 Tax=Polygala tenuifolia TaxID=355332 RepID=A0A1Z2WV01_9FABA|nr:cytochrome P450 CYP714E38 [Polygala tenuifolia]